MANNRRRLKQFHPQYSEITMHVGVPAEIKNNEFRVAKAHGLELHAAL